MRKEITVPGGSVFVNPSTEEQEVGRYVTIGKHTPEGGIGGLGIEVDEILTRSGSKLAGDQTKL